MKKYSIFILTILCVTIKSFSAKGFDEIDSVGAEIQIYSMVSEMPEFIHKDYESFESFLKSKLRYPLIAKQKKIYDTVLLDFVVDVDGIVKNVEVVKGEYPCLDYEAIVAVNGTSGWKAGKIDGLPVPVRLRTSVSFLATDSLPINEDNSIQSYSELNEKIVLDTTFHELNYFILEFMNWANSPGWYNCNNSFKYMKKKVAKFDFESDFESIFVVFKTERTEKKDRIGVFNEKEEIKELLKKPENKSILVIGVKIIDNQTFLGYKTIEPNGDLVSLEYKGINKNDLIIELNRLGIKH
jgi:TonB family protein